MKYLAITQKTADWLIRTPNALKSILTELDSITQTQSLKEGVLAVGSLRACADKSNVLCLWNTDYTTASGSEEWGFILLVPENGLFSNRSIIAEVFERSLFVINQRLQALLLPDDRYIHRNLGDNIHCCLAGRGVHARQYSIGYIEGVYSVDDSEIRSILTVGPWGGGIEQIKRLVQKEGQHIEDLIQSAVNILNDAAKRPAIDSTAFMGLRQYFLPQSLTRGLVPDKLPIVEVPELEEVNISQNRAYETLSWDYEKWIDEENGLSDTQRAILVGDVLLKQPLRLIGAAGSGKTLLMHLLCIRRLEDARKNNQPIRILYVVHNNDMADTMINRFVTLGAEKYLEEKSEQRLIISTLFGYSKERLGLPETAIIDKDAYQTKIFQRDVVKKCIKDVISNSTNKIEKSYFLKELSTKVESLDVYAD